MEGKKIKTDIKIEKEGSVVLSGTISSASPDKDNSSCKKVKNGENTSYRNRELCLNESTIQGMLQRFLVKKKMSKKKLAQVLSISTEELESLFLKRIPSKLVTKINLPLIKQYCKTRWNEERKNKT